MSHGAGGQPADIPVESRKDANTTHDPLAGMHDIRGPVAVATLPPFALSGGVLLLFGGLWLLRRRRHASTAVAPAVTPSACREGLAGLAAEYRQGQLTDEEAIRRLDALLREAMTTAGFPAHVRTSLELRILAEDRLDPTARRCLADLLALGDQAKFACHQPGSAAIGQALLDAETLFTALARCVTP